jgi:hypothetical protein
MSGGKVASQQSSAVWKGAVFLGGQTNLVILLFQKSITSVIIV